MMQQLYINFDTISEGLHDFSVVETITDIGSTLSSPVRKQIKTPEEEFPEEIEGEEDEEDEEVKVAEALEEINLDFDSLEFIDELTDDLLALKKNFENAIESYISRDFDVYLGYNKETNTVLVYVEDQDSAFCSIVLYLDEDEFDINGNNVLKANLIYLDLDDDGVNDFEDDIEIDLAGFVDYDINGNVIWSSMSFNSSLTNAMLTAEAYFASEYTIKKFDIEDSGTYISVKPTTESESLIKDVLEKEIVFEDDINRVALDEIHTTLIYSRVGRMVDVFPQRVYSAKISNVGFLGEGDDKGLVVFLESESLSIRNKKLLEQGLTSDYLDYKPYFTLAYGADIEDKVSSTLLASLNEAFVNKILNFTQETIEPLDTEWVKEELNESHVVRGGKVIKLPAIRRKKRRIKKRKKKVSAATRAKISKALKKPQAKKSRKLSMKIRKARGLNKRK